MHDNAGKTFFCSFCQKPAKSLNALEAHMYTVHRGVKKVGGLDDPTFQWIKFIIGIKSHAILCFESLYQYILNTFRNLLFHLWQALLKIRCPKDPYQGYPWKCRQNIHLWSLPKTSQKSQCSKSSYVYLSSCWKVRSTSTEILVFNCICCRYWRSQLRLLWTAIFQKRCSECPHQRHTREQGQSFLLWTL